MKLLPISEIDESSMTVGMQFRPKHRADRFVTITSINFIEGRQKITYTNHRNEVYTRSVNGFISSMRLNDFFYIDQSADSGARVVVEKPCSHLNVRKERYFSNHIYETCKDCNKPLN